MGDRNRCAQLPDRICAVGRTGEGDRSTLGHRSTTGLFGSCLACLIGGLTRLCDEQTPSEGHTVNADCSSVPENAEGDGPAPAGSWIEEEHDGAGKANEKG